ncbi:MAG: YqgE/AlgH family protein [Mariprofundaceae bacterium]|nr:YqgE/AlgH family protein [Mariprofundaceae bacterium]
MLLNDFKGQLLLATPSLQERQFKDTVILLCHHDSEGSMGLIINRPQNISIVDVFEDIQLTPSDHIIHTLMKDELHSYEGGPIDPFRGFVIHDGQHVYESTMPITPEIHLTTSKDVLEQIVQEQGPQHFMLVLGYTGWDAGQLEQEMMDNHWLIAPASEQLIFHIEPELRWARAAQSLGVEKSHLSSQIGHA